LAETLETNDLTVIARRIEGQPRPEVQPPKPAPDRFRAPVAIDVPRRRWISTTANRANDKGFLPMSMLDYIRLLD
jgi:hypothetical protein